MENGKGSFEMLNLGLVVEEREEDRVFYSLTEKE